MSPSPHERQSDVLQRLTLAESEPPCVATRTTGICNSLRPGRKGFNCLVQTATPKIRSSRRRTTSSSTRLGGDTELGARRLPPEQSTAGRVSSGQTPGEGMLRAMKTLSSGAQKSGYFRTAMRPSFDGIQTRKGARSEREVDCSSVKQLPAG